MKTFWGVIELTAKTPQHDAAMDRGINDARAKMDRWQASKATVEA